ncbi:MAG: carbohydrate ABC transporter permease, partial [Candidatus Aminicenantes bacterium]|nr:carbohydrate ABC transporter permease [Candidatus Aminicenantes bacterium]
MKCEKNRTIVYFLLILTGFVMVFPLVWLISAAFKPNNEIFGTLSLIPSNLVWDSFQQGWRGSGQFSFGVFFMNTFKLVIPVVVFTLLSSILVAYGFARFEFPFKNILFM